jgi:hypothetical protein
MVTYPSLAAGVEEWPPLVACSSLAAGGLLPTGTCPIPSLTPATSMGLRVRLLYLSYRYFTMLKVKADWIFGYRFFHASTTHELLRHGQKNFIFGFKMQFLESYVVTQG